MSVSLRDDVVYLEDSCRVEDAETLVGFLQEKAGRTVDVTHAGHLHAAILQVLLAFRPPIAGPAGDSFVSAYVEPLLAIKSSDKALP